MFSSPQPNTDDDDGLEAAVDQAIAACGGDMRSTIRALIVANEFLENEVGELMKAVSHAYARGRFQPIPDERARSSLNGLGLKIHEREGLRRPVDPAS